MERVAGCAGLNVRVVIDLGLNGESQLRGLVRSAGSCPSGSVPQRDIAQLTGRRRNERDCGALSVSTGDEAAPRHHAALPGWHATPLTLA